MTTTAHHLIAVGAFIAYVTSVLAILAGILFEQPSMYIHATIGILATSTALYYKHKSHNSSHEATKIIIAGAIGAITAGFIGSVLIIIGGAILTKQQTTGNQEQDTAETPRT